MQSSTLLHRAMKIIRYLRSNSGSTSKQICEEIESDSEVKTVELRQIQRDLRTLQDEQIIESERDGHDILWSLRREWRNVLPTTFTGHELLSLYVLKSYLTHFKGTSIERDAERLLKKIKGSAKGEVVSLTLNHTFGHFDYSVLHERVTQCVECVRDARWINVTYFNPTLKREKSYPVFPCRLFVFNSELYMVVYNEHYNNYLALALRNIRSIDEADSKALPHVFNEQRFTRERFGVFSGNPKKIKLLIRSSMAEFFANRIWHPSQHFTPKRNGDVVLEMEVPLSTELVSWILSWKTYIVVLKPKTLVEMIVSELDGMRAVYK